MTNEQLDAAIRALQTGDRREARRLLGIILGAEPDNVPAWWYLAEALDDTEQKSRCLRQVLRLHPEHAEARRMLAEMGRRAVKVTPPEGLIRPVFEAEDQDGRLIVADIQKPYPPAHARPLRVPPIGLIVAAGVALGMLLAILVLAQSGILRNWPGVRDPAPESTLRPLVFEVHDCTSIGQSQTTLNFVNDTVVTVEILQGQPGQEIKLLTLEPGEQSSVEVEPGLQVRYAARTDVPGFTGSGAIIQVPQGSTCEVPIK